MKLTKAEHWAIERICEKFKGLGGKVEIVFEGGKFKEINASARIDPATLGVAPESEPSLDNPSQKKVVDALE